MTRFNRQYAGVTLIELLIVMSILVVISSLGLPSVLRMVERTRLTSAAKELQAELNRTRLESMKSGEPLVFHYQPGTGCYEILSKQEYDLRYPPQQLTQPFLPNAGMMSDMGAMPDMGMMPPDATDQSAQQAAGSTGPTFADRGSTSLVDSIAGQSRSLTDSVVNAPSFADLGPAPSLTDQVLPPDMQMIAAIPVSKFLPVNKELPHNLTFGGLQASGFGLQASGFGSPLSGSSPSTPIPYSLSPIPSSWSEPILFFPNGRTSNAFFSVCSTTGNGYYIDVTVRGLTGTARLGDLEVLP